MARDDQTDLRNLLLQERARTLELETTVRSLQAERARLHQSVNRESNSRLMAEEALDQTKERLQIAVEASRLALWEWNIRASEVYMTERWAEIIGDIVMDGYWPLANLAQRMHPDDFERLCADLVPVLKGHKERLVAEYRVRGLDGYVWLESTGVVCERDAHGRALRMIGTHADISERRKVAADLDLALQKAQASSRAKSEFLANISHEVRTPMNAIVGLTNVLLEGKLLDGQADYLRMIDTSAHGLLDLLNNVLDFSKIESGKVVLEKIRFNVQELVDETVQLYAVAARAKGLVVRAKVLDNVPKVLIGDPGRLRQVLSNLVSNAVKFTDTGSISIQVAVAQQQQPQAQVRLGCQITDTGIGIPLERQADIFNAFVQADSSTTRKYGGTGLGLAICAKLVQLLGGQIQVFSVPGRGSSFRFDALFTAAADSEQSQGDTPLHADHETLHGLHVLLAEDHPVNELLAKRLLDKIGCTYEVASNGEQAVQRWANGGIDLVLMDVQMPVMDGFAATAQIREREQGKHRTPIVALTAHAVAGDRERCIEHGMDAYASKPVSLDGLAQAMREAISACGQGIG